jgi:rhodanese-related sulfurtransferase
MDHSPRFLAIVTDAKTRVTEITIDEVQKKLDRGERFELIDVREDGEWAAGRTNAEIVLYCGGGFRSALAADNLRRMGYMRVLSMAGGWRDWVAAGGPTDR